MTDLLGSVKIISDYKNEYTINREWKILFTVILLSTTTSAQNTYGVQPGVKNNQIVLELSNIPENESSNTVEI